MYRSSSIEVSVTLEKGRSLLHRRDGEAQNLAQLTGRDINEIRKKMQIGPVAVTSPINETWWEKIWKK